MDTDPTNALTYRRLLVPLDGSELAERSLPVAARVARGAHADLVLVQVVDPAAYLATDYAAPQYVIQAIEESAAAYLREVSQRSALAGISVSVKVLEGAPTAKVILEAATAEHVDLIVISSHGRSGALRWALGSVAEKITHHAPMPVLLLRAGEPKSLDPPLYREPSVQALVSLDGSSFAEAALLPAARLVAALATPARGALHILRILDPTYIGTERGERVLMDRDTCEAAREDASRYLRDIAARFDEGGLAALKLQVTWSVREDWDVAAAILSIAEGEEQAESGVNSKRCDLICMATHGRGGLQRWAVGSVAERVLRGSKLPLLIVRPRELEGMGAAQPASHAAAEPSQGRLEKRDPKK